jgi:hypothetical protein
MGTRGATLTKHDIDRLHKFDWEVDGFAGLDNSSDPSALPDNFSPNLLNVLYDLTGAVETRKGYTKLITNSLPGAIVNGHPFYKSDGTKLLVFAVNCTNAGTAPGGVTGTYLYKYDNAGGGTLIGGPYTINTFWDFTTIRNNVYAVNGVDGVFQWGGSGSFINISTFPIQYIENRKNRLYGAKLNSSLLYFTDPSNYGTWGNFIEINTDDGQTITSIKKYFDDVVIFKTQSVWYAQGEPLGTGASTTLGNIQIRQADSEVGCPAPLSIRKIRQGILMWVCESGVAVMQNYHATIISDKIEATFKNDMNANFISKIWAIYSPPEKKYIFGYPSASSSTPDKAMMLDMSNPKVVRYATWDHYPGSCAMLFRFTLRDSVLIGHPTKGYIVQAFQGYADIAGDNGTASAGTSTTLSDSTKAWTTNQFVDADVTIVAGTGAGQQRTVSANSATQLTLSAAWTTTPDATSVYSIGAYTSYVDTPIEDFGKSAYDKKVKYFNLFSDSHTNQNLLFGYATAYQQLNFSTQKPLSSGGMVWEGVGSPDKWGAVGKKWGTKKQVFIQFEVGDADKHFQARWGNNLALNPWRTSKYTVTLKFKKVRPDVV